MDRLKVPDQPQVSRSAIGGSVGLLLMFAFLSWQAISTKSSTYDEPVHAMGSWLATWYGDFRVDPENPPLWEHWAALPQGTDALQMNRAHFDSVLKDENERFKLTIATLYQTPGQDGEKFVRRSRAMMLIVGVALGAVIAAWAGKLAGGAAAVVACTLFCFDPNFLGHSPLVKNDVAITLAMTGLAFAVWLAGLRLTIARAALVAAALAACVTIKFSGLIWLAILPLLLLGRALVPGAWTVFGRSLANRTSRATAAVALILFSVLFSWGSIWACYHFRYSPTPNPGVTLDQDALYWRLGMSPPQPGLMPIDLNVGEVQYRGWPFAPLRWIVAAHLLPEAYMHGLLYQMETTRQRIAFLCGRYSMHGWWYYFPLAMLFKTPLTTIALVLASAVWVCARAWKMVRKNPREPTHSPAEDRRFRVVWAAACLAIPFIIFLTISMRSHLNIGLRHVFPLYPAMFITAAVAAGNLRRAYPKPSLVFGIVLAALLAAESFSAFPNYIAFFNVACGSSRGGLRLLGDSNLDWGQDLPALAQWRDDHPQNVLRINYFGSVDPLFYGMQTVLTPPGPSDVYAVSATYLQGIYGNDDLRLKMARLRQEQPLDVLGGTIYLYPWPSILHAKVLEEGASPLP